MIKQYFTSRSIILLSKLFIHILSPQDHHIFAYQPYPICMQYPKTQLFNFSLFFINTVHHPSIIQLMHYYHQSWRLQFYWHIMSKIQSKSLVLASKVHQKGTLSPVHPKEKVSALDFNYKTKQDPLWGKDQSYFRRKLNEGLEYEKQFVNKTGMAQSVYNNPESNYTLDRSDFYRRQRYQSAKKESTPIHQRLDVLNNQKALFSGRNEEKYYTSFRGQTSSVSGSESPFRKTLTHLMRFQPEITAKIGASSNRDYTIPRPQLKVGKNDFIDTYSPF